jgi:hypothetical protein
MLGQGVHPKLLSEMIGHATVAITLDTYSQATAAMRRVRRASSTRCSARCQGEPVIRSS